MKVGQLEGFLRRLSSIMELIESFAKRNDTVTTRISRRFSLREVASLLDVDPTALTKPSNDPSFPEGERRGRERTFSVQDIMLIRAIMASNPRVRKQQLFWRDPDSTDAVPVVCFSSLKGGSGKSITASHFAQYLNLYYGMRVGIIDSDPQATTTLYFSNEQIDTSAHEDETISSFMGVQDFGASEATPVPAERLNTMWRETPWPGIRIVPGGPEIQSGDLNLFNISMSAKQTDVHLLLKDALDRWQSAYPARSRPSDLRDAKGNFDIAAYREALNECVDVIIIDQQPSLTLTQLNGIFAATNLAVTISPRGFDINSLHVYLRSVRQVLEDYIDTNPHAEVGPGNHFLVATLVQGMNQKDQRQWLQLLQHAPRDILPVFYAYSAAVSSASEDYMSNYEWVPSGGERISQARFLQNANAVNDSMFKRVFPDLPDRGFEDERVNELFGEGDEAEFIENEDSDLEAAQ